MCVHQETNGEAVKCPIQALVHRVVPLCQNEANGEIYLSAFYKDGKCYDICGEDVSKSLKMAAGLLDYPTTWGIPIKLIDTHSFQSGGANALALSC